MNTITIDFETYYDNEYSLSNLTTQQYIHDDRFEVIGVAVRLLEGHIVFCTGDIDYIKEFLQGYLWDDSLCIAHNAMFDGYILEHIFDIHPKRYYCTMQASRVAVVQYNGGRMGLAAVAEHYGLEAKGTEVHAAKGKHREDFTSSELGAYGDYCCKDVRLSYQIYERTRHDLPDIEQDMLDLTIKKFTHPVFVLDKLLIAEELLKEVTALKHCKAEATMLTGIENFRQNEPLAVWLRGEGIPIGMKESPTTGKQVYAFAKTDEFMKDLADHPRDIVRLVHAARIGSKSTINITRLKRFLDIALLDVPFCVPLLFWGAHTGRFSGLDKLNLQNLPRNGSLRAAICAPEGSKVVAGDLSQIEARIVAVLAGEEELVQAFEEGRDVYCEFASIIYGREITKANKRERFLGKQAILLLGYGGGAFKFRVTCAGYGVTVTEEEAEDIVSLYRKTYSGVPRLWRTLNNALVSMFEGSEVSVSMLKFGENMISLPNGTYIHYPNLHYSEVDEGMVYTKGRINSKKIYGGACLENIGQALANIVLRRAEQRLAVHGFPARLNIHDELLYVIKDEKVEPFKKALSMVLTREVPWMPELPVACEVAVGQNYAEAK